MNQDVVGAEESPRVVTAERLENRTVQITVSEIIAGDLVAILQCVNSLSLIAARGVSENRKKLLRALESLNLPINGAKEWGEKPITVTFPRLQDSV